MSLEAVEYVKEAEERAKQIEINGDKKIQEISQTIKQKVSENNQNMKQELYDYEDVQQKMFDDRLATEEEAVDKVLSVEIVTMLKSVENKQSMVVDRIVKEVINHYGNS